MREGSGELWQRLHQRVDGLPPELADHCRGTAEECRILARRFGLGEEVAAVAGLAHDLARAMGPQELVARARSYGLSVGVIEDTVPLLLHGPVAAELLRREEPATDGECLEAIAWHTTGRAGMPPLAQVLFLGDKLEARRGNLQPGMAKIKLLAQEDLGRALLELYDLLIQSFVQRGALLHPATVEARNHLLLALRPSPPEAARSAPGG